MGSARSAGDATWDGGAGNAGEACTTQDHGLSGCVGTLRYSPARAPRPDKGTTIAMAVTTTCEFGHLMVLLAMPPILAKVCGPAYYGHVHEDEALACCYFENMGWPRPAPPGDSRAAA